jgi:galactose mutarotase-like enzyme
MNTLANTFSVRQFQGFALYTLRNAQAALAVVPELGAKIISLRDLQTQREWLWHPGEDLDLFENQPTDAFSDSPLVGMDECLPTILPCTWRGRKLPDHGEAWNRPWEVDMEAWREGILKTSIRLKSSPFVFERTIALQEAEIQLNYKMSNVGDTEEHFLWAVHPLLRLTAGDRLELPGSTRQLLNGADWVDDVASAGAAKNCAKAFAHPLSEGWAAVRNEATRDRLKFTWDPVQNKSLGLWITRGGWHGHHHFAIEPSNADHDCLATASARNRCGVVAANSSVAWQLKLRVGAEEL